VDLEDLDAGRGEKASEAGAVAAGSLDAGETEIPERGGPGEELAVAGEGSRNGDGAEDTTEMIQSAGDVEIGMGIHSKGDTQAQESSFRTGDTKKCRPEGGRYCERPRKSGQAPIRSLNAAG